MHRRLLALLVLMLFVAGCWSRVEVNDLAIVSMFGMDRTEDDQIKLWLHVIIPSRAGGTSATGTSTSESGLPFVTLTATGSTIMEAAHYLQTQLPRRIFWAHARVILLGERLSRQGTRAVVDFLTRHRQLRLTSYVLVVGGDMDDMMATEVDLEKLPAEYIREIQRSKIITVATLRDWVQSMASKGQDPILPLVDLVPPPPGAPGRQHPSLRLRGAALFQDDRMVEVAERNVARGIGWLRDQIELEVLTVAIPGVEGHVSVEWLTSRVSRKVRLEKDRPVFTVEVLTEGDVSESQTRMDLANPSQLRRVEQQLNAEIKGTMEAAISLMRSLNIDSVGFGELLHQQRPSAWARLEAKWPGEAFAKSRIHVSVDARVRRTGLSSTPAGVPEDQLIKGRN